MIAKYLICIGCCIVILFFSLYLIIVCADRLNKCEDIKAGFYAALLIIGFLFSIASGIGTVVLVIQTIANFLHE